MGAFCSCLDTGHRAGRDVNDQALKVSPERQLSAHSGKPSSQQPLPSEAQKPPELRELSLKTRSLERGVPASVSSPSLSLLADDSQRNGVHEKEAVARDNSTKEEKMQRAMSWSQAPAIISRMTSWKEAGKDYNAMQVALQNFPASLSEQAARTASVPTERASLEHQNRELSSAPELFTDAAMRNALRKIAALQAKAQPRSRPSSTRASAFSSPRVSSEGDAGTAPASHEASPGGFEAGHSKFMPDSRKRRQSCSSDLSGLPPGSRAASSDAGSRAGSRPPSTDAYHKGNPAHTFTWSNDMLTGQRPHGCSEVLLSRQSRPMSVDGQAFSSHGPSGEQSVLGGSTLQRSSSEANSALNPSISASDESLSMREGHHRQAPGGHALGEIPELAPTDYAPDRSTGSSGTGTARQWGPSASGMRRVPENKAAEAFEVLMSRAQGCKGGSINSEDAAAVNAYVRDGLAGPRLSTDSGRSMESRVSSVGMLNGSAVVHASDAHAALKRALSLVKKQEDCGVSVDQGCAEQSSSIGDWQAIPREQRGSPELQMKQKLKQQGLSQGDWSATKHESGGVLKDQGRTEQSPSIGDWQEQRGQILRDFQMKQKVKQQDLPHGNWSATKHEQRILPQLQQKQQLARSGYSASTSDAAIQDFVRSAFSTPTTLLSADSQNG